MTIRLSDFDELVDRLMETDEQLCRPIHGAAELLGVSSCHHGDCQTDRIHLGAYFGGGLTPAPPSWR